MGKSTNFSGKLIFNQLLKFIDKREIRKPYLAYWPMLISLVRRSTFSEANGRRSSKVFGDIYIYAFLEDLEGSWKEIN